MNFRASLWMLILGFAASAVHAEPVVYVIEQLVVSIASAPGDEGERVGQVKSGDKLELIEREGEEAHVRLPNGKDGWIKASYVSSEEPLQVRLTARTAELEKLKQESDKLRQDVSRLQTELASAKRVSVPPPASAASAESNATRPGTTPGYALKSGTATASSTTPPARPSGAAESSSGESADAANTEAPPAPIRETVFLRSPDRPGQTPWAVILGVSAVMLLVGFVLGWSTLDRRIRHKYGGLRIY